MEDVNSTTYTLLIDAEKFWQRLEADIQAAQKRVYIQTLSFEGDRVGRMLSDRVMASLAHDKRIIVDYYTKYVLSDKFRFSPKNWFNRELRREHRATSRMITDLHSDGTSVKFVNPVGPLLVRMPARNHKKIIVIDDNISYLGGINFSEHNFAWHDLMMRIENKDIAEFLAGDFLNSWEGRHFAGRCRSGDITVHAFDGKTNREAFEPILQLIRSAESSIYVQSPYLSFPFTGALREAASRGIPVTVVTPEKNNKRPLQEYIEWEAARSGFDLRLYQKGMTHLKAMLIDDRYLIIGSCNFDYFSYYFEQETVAIISDNQVIAEFKNRVIERDDTHCVRGNGARSSMKGYLRSLQIKSIGRIMGVFNRRR